MVDSFSSGELAIAICDRCHRKRPYMMLGPDPNAPGLRVCYDPPPGEPGSCGDQFDPWRLPARQPEPIALKYPRPDAPLTIGPEAPWALILPGPRPPPLIPLPPTDMLLDNSTLLELSNGAQVGDVTVIDPQLPDTVETLTVLNDTRFIVPMLSIDTGKLELRIGEQIVFSEEPTVHLVLRATNSFGLFLDKAFDIQVIPFPPPPQPPITLTLDNATVPEHTPAAIIGTLVASDPNTPPAAQSITVQNDARFEVVTLDSFSGTLKLKAGQQVDFATEPSISLIIRTTNTFALFLEHTFVITVLGTPHVPPTDITLDNLTVLEHTLGALVGTVSVADPQLPSTTETITVSDPRFTVAPINNFSGTLSLLPGQQVDAATEPTITLTLRATNSFGLFLDKPFTITVTPLGPPPTARAHSSAFSKAFQ